MNTEQVLLGAVGALNLMLLVAGWLLADAYKSLKHRLEKLEAENDAIRHDHYGLAMRFTRDFVTRDDLRDQLRDLADKIDKLFDLVSLKADK